ncbi:MAG: hypothetical protein O3B87_04065 [bacterium]|nr:hypothetical protein [bacterium]
MKLRYFFACFAVLISLVFYLRLPKQDQKAQAIFSPVAANPTNLIDISKLTLDAYKHISEENGAVFVLKNNSQKQVYFDDKQLQSLEISPSQKQAAFYYDPNETDELKEHELSLMIFGLTNKSVKEVFHTTHPSWDVRSNLHWLGNNHLFFLRHCGTACQGITLLNIETGETKNAVLSYSSFPDQPEITSFQDWLGREYQMGGLVREVTSQTVDNNHYLVFILEDEAGKSLGEKRILFSDSEMSTLSSAKL